MKISEDKMFYMFNEKQPTLEEAQKIVGPAIILEGGALWN